MSNAEEIKRRGWRQGSFVGGELARKVKEETGLGSGELYVVISQDCDVVNRSFEVEPNVELIVAQRGAKRPDANREHGKNPRVLHLPTTEGGHLGLDIRHRTIVDRRILATQEPSGGLDSRSADLLRKWVAKRYARPAFPDAFNERVRPAGKKIESALKKFGKGASGVFLRLSSWGELAKDHEYRVVVVVTCPVAVAESEEAEVEVAELVSALMAALDGCDGIAVIDAQHLGEADFTLHDLRVYKRWDFDYRSHSGRPGGPVVPSGE